MFGFFFIIFYSIFFFNFKILFQSNIEFSMKTKVVEFASRFDWFLVIIN